MDKNNNLILGISAFYHDSAIALINDGEIIFAAQEERFTRKKFDASFPINSIRACLKANNISITDIDYIVFYDDPKLKLKRIISTFIDYAPKGYQMFKKISNEWRRKKNLDEIISKLIQKNFEIMPYQIPEIFYSKHHYSHAASAFFPSNFEESMVLCVDGVGEYDTTSIWYGYENELSYIKGIKFPHSLGLIYSAFTQYLGFRVNSGEYKLMGLAPYGEPKYVNLIFEKLVSQTDDGSFKLNMKYFCFPYQNQMVNENFCKLFGMAVKLEDEDFLTKHLDIACSIQRVLEIMLLKIVNNIFEEYQIKNLCMAGGVALNCVANSKILNETPIENIWIQPAAGDSGGAVGAALGFWYDHLNNARKYIKKDTMKYALLGTKFSSDEIETTLLEHKAVYKKIKRNDLYKTVSKYLAKGNIVGWFQDKMEFGPRALGNRSILADARNPEMQTILNLKIKKRESFRPFAPIIKYEKLQDWFDWENESPYMLFTASVNENKKIKSKSNHDGLNKLHEKRSFIQSVTHVDYSARIQTVSSESNPELYQLLDEFENLTGSPVLINTSFNQRGEPIVNSPNDAFECFMRTEMDLLIIEDIILSKNEQTIDQTLFETEFEKD